MSHSTGPKWARPHPVQGTARGRAAAGTFYPLAEAFCQSCLRLFLRVTYSPTDRFGSSHCGGCANAREEGWQENESFRLSPSAVACHTGLPQAGKEALLRLTSSAVACHTLSTRWKLTTGIKVLLLPFLSRKGSRMLLSDEFYYIKETNYLL